MGVYGYTIKYHSGGIKKKSIFVTRKSAVASLGSIPNNSDWIQNLVGNTLHDVE